MEARNKSVPDSKPRIITVTCVTGPDTWRIENDYIKGANTHLWFYDGTNVYSMLESTVNVWPSRDGHPLGMVSENIPGLAFCSGPYLKREGRLIPLPAAVLRHTRDRYAYTDRTTTFPDELGLPKTVDLFASEKMLRTSEDDFDPEAFFGNRYEAAKKQNMARMEEGKLTFHYEATETTNFHGHLYPTRFRFSQEGRDYQQNGDWTWQGTGTVKSIASCPKPEGLIKPNQKCTVEDNRFRDEDSEVDGIFYVSNNNFLAPTNDPALQREFSASIARNLVDFENLKPDER